MEQIDCETLEKKVDLQRTFLIYVHILNPKPVIILKLKMDDNNTPSCNYAEIAYC